MSDFDPGLGWRKEPYRDDLANDFAKYIYYFNGEAGVAVTWVPEEPVPTLGRDSLTDPDDYRLIANVLTALAKWKDAKR